MAVTMKDIAQASGVSTATVSKIINGNDKYISENTRKTVNSIIKEMGYVPNALAKGLKIKKTKMIGFILPDISNPFFPEVAKGIEYAAQKRGFGVVMCNTNDSAESELECFQFLSSRMVDGIVFIRALRKGNLEKYFHSGIPIVLVDREIEASTFGFGQIFIDTQKGVYESTKALIDAGCKKIAFISAEYTSSNDRYHGYCTALKKEEIDVDVSLVFRERYNVETGRKGIRHILKNSTVDGVVCGNDLIAVGVINTLSELGLKVPNDIKVIGFDDIYFSQHMNPPLSTVYQPAYDMGTEAANMLIDNILYGNPLYKKQLDYELVIRGTV